MKGFCISLCLLVSVNLVLGQFGFFQRRDDISPFKLAQNFVPTANRLRDTLGGLFNIRPRPMPAIINDQDREQGDQPYNPNYQNNFNRPVVFPTSHPQERPVDNYPGEQPNQNNPNQGQPMQYPDYQPYYDTVHDQKYTQRPVSFPAQDPTNAGSTFDYNPGSSYDYNAGSINDYGASSNMYGDQGESQGGNGQTTQYDQNGSQNTNYFNQNTPNGAETSDYNMYSSKAPVLDKTEGQKYEDRFGTVDMATTLPTLTEPPNFESRNVDFGIFTDTCQTVENEIGSCINLKQCPPYVKLLQEFKANPGAVKILRSAHCGFDGNDPKVCCPRPGLPTAAPQTTTTSTTTAAPTTTTTRAPSPVVEPSGKSIDPEDFVLAFPEPPVCGVSNASFSRVVGGVDAKLGDFPWMALLGYKKRNNPTQWLCGGSLVTSKHVLTAAHCVHTKENELYLVRLGELDLARDDEGATPLDVLIKHMVKHEQYSPKAYTNDIAVLVLEREVEFSDLIRPICIPQTAELRSISFEDYTPMVAGWGNLEARGPAATHLQVVQLPVVSNEFCRQAYRNYTQQKIDERVLCAGYKNGGKDSCRGDSGGPLMQPIWNNKNFKTYFFQIGVVSFGKGCAEAGFPGVYSRVTNFVPWLQEKVTGQA